MTTRIAPAAAAAHNARPMLVRLHPVAVMGICDAYERRKEKAFRVVGTLMGRVDNDVVEVTNCFVVPHEEGAQTALRLDTDFAQSMMELTKRASPQEDVVGWFSTQSGILETSFYIHDFYVRLSNPNIIHLTIDCTGSGDRMPIKAYVWSPLGVLQTARDPKDPNARFEQAALFAQVPVEVFCWDAERVGLDLIQNGRLNPQRTVNIPTDVEQVLETAKLLDDQMESVLKYIDKVLVSTISFGPGNVYHLPGTPRDEESIFSRNQQCLLRYLTVILVQTFEPFFMRHEVPPDPEVGRELMDIAGAIPKIDEEAFEKMVNSSRKDVLMVMYLSELAKAQLAIQEKVNILP